jgi:hypothetical protein
MQILFIFGTGIAALIHFPFEITDEKLKKITSITPVWKSTEQCRK